MIEEITPTPKAKSAEEIEAEALELELEKIMREADETLRSAPSISRETMRGPLEGADAGGYAMDTGGDVESAEEDLYKKRKTAAGRIVRVKKDGVFLEVWNPKLEASLPEKEPLQHGRAIYNDPNKPFYKKFPHLQGWWHWDENVHGGNFVFDGDKPYSGPTETPAPSPNLSSEPVSYTEDEARLRQLEEELAILKREEELGSNKTPEALDSTISTPPEARDEKLRDVFDLEFQGTRYRVDEDGNALVYLPPKEGRERRPRVVKEGDTHRFKAEDGKWRPYRWGERKWSLAEISEDTSNDTSKPTTTNTEVKAKKDDPSAKKEPGIVPPAIAPAPVAGSTSFLDTLAKPFTDLIKTPAEKHAEEIADLKQRIEKVTLEKTKATLEKELAGLTATPAEKIPDSDLLAKWEFADNTQFSERGERMKAALRARNEGIHTELSLEHQLNKAKYFYEIADKWKKFPLWAKVGIPTGILAAGTISTALAPATAVFAGVTWLAAATWRGLSAVATGAVMGTSTYTYLKKRNSRHAGLISTIVGLASGSAAFVGGKYLAEYLNVHSSSGGEGMSPPRPAPDLTWSGPEEVPYTAAIAQKGIGGFMTEHMFGNKGLLAPYNFSPEAQAEFTRLSRETLVGSGNQAFLEEFSAGAKDVEGEVIIKQGAPINPAIYGDEKFLHSLFDRMSSGGRLAQELAQQGGSAGLKKELLEVFARK